MMSSIMELSKILESLLVHLLIWLRIDLEMIIWFPDVVSLLSVIVLLILVINKMNSMDHIVSRKNLKRMIGVFFGIIVVQTFYVVYVNGFMYDQFSELFAEYYRIRRESYISQACINFIPLLKYLVFGVVLFLKRDEANGKGINTSNQISEIGES